MFKYLYLIAIILILISCNEESQPTSDDNETFNPYSGLMRTNQFGVVDTAEDDDWEPICYDIPSFGPNFFCMYPPKNNPGTDTITVRFSNRLNCKYRITVHKSDRVPVDTIYNDILSSGNYDMQITFSEKYERGRIYRVFIQAIESGTAATQLRWGDIMWLETEE